tara:strand:- start:358 stop:504 length:147 start_codon:yes stop_codon:yes gene_type:complete
MKRLFLTLFTVGILATSFTSCREQNSAADDVEDAVDDAGDAIEDAVDD